jgi:UDP-N-acetylglucosamine:LPS N-acetylglucosamine transferase
VARAIQTELKLAAPEATVVLRDALELTSLRTRLDPAQAYRLLATRLVKLYDAVYLASDGSRRVHGLRRLIRWIWGSPMRHLIRQEDPDIVVSTHHFASPSTIVNYPTGLPYVTVVTDLTHQHHIWFDKGSTLVCIPERVRASETRRPLDISNQVLPIGYPIHRDFLTVASNHASVSHRILYMASGCGRNVHEQVLELAQARKDLSVTAICGADTASHRFLVGKHTPMQVIEHSDDVYRHMVGSDLVLTKAGPAVIVEAAVLRKPLIIAGWLGQQERANASFVRRRRLGVELDDGGLVESVRLAYESYGRFASLRSEEARGARDVVEGILPFISHSRVFRLVR